MNLTTSLLALSALYDVKPSSPINFFRPINGSIITPAHTNATAPSAPLYHNVSTDVAWILPDGKQERGLGVGGRDVTCECFDPDCGSNPFPEFGQRRQCWLTKTTSDLLHAINHLDRPFLHSSE